MLQEPRAGHDSHLADFSERGSHDEERRRRRGRTQLRWAGRTPSPRRGVPLQPTDGAVSACEQEEEEEAVVVVGREDMPRK